MTADCYIMLSYSFANDAVCGHCGSIASDTFNGAVEHALYKGLIVVLCEGVRPLSGFQAGI